jgi:serine/threonine-protein kinase
MAEAWLAEPLGALGGMRSLVVKRLHAHLGAKPEVARLFKSEARLAVMMSHPNVVQTVEVGQSDEGWFIVMEFVDGLSLRQLLRSLRAAGEKLPAPLAARLLADACAGMAYAHGLVDPATGKPLNVVHRDLSPDNLVLSRAGVLKVLDFGVARARGQLHHTEPGRVRGKLEYMAPEQLLAQPVDARADIYSLGGVLYELLAGVRPHGGDSDAERMRALLQDEPVPLGERRPDVPAQLLAVVDRAMARLPTERYADCGEMLDALEAYLLECGVPAGRPQLSALAQRWASAAAPPAPSPVRTEAVTEEMSQSALAPGTTVRFRGPRRRGPEDVSTVTLKAQPRRKPLPRSWRRTAVVLSVVSVCVLGAAGAWWFVRAGPVRTAVPGAAPPAVAAALPRRPPPPAPLPPAEAMTPPEVQERPSAESVPGRTPAPARRAPERRVPPPAEKVAAPEARETPEPPRERFPVTLRVMPWATVYVDGELVGETPMGPVMLEAGVHRVRLVNGELGVEREVALEVGTGHANSLRVQLEPEPTANGTGATSPAP